MVLEKGQGWNVPASSTGLKKSGLHLTIPPANRLQSRGSYRPQWDRDFHNAVYFYQQKYYNIYTWIFENRVRKNIKSFYYLAI